MSTTPARQFPTVHAAAAGAALPASTARWRLFARGGASVLPVAVGLVVIAVVFQSLNSNYLTPVNLTNMLLQVTATGVMAVGVFLVLLLGEVDLSVGSVSGMTSAVMAVLYVQRGINPWLAVLAALVSGALVGALQGLIFTRLGLPAFVVTLAGLIGWQGLQLYVLGSTGTINLPAGPLTAITSTFLPAAVTWAALVIVVVGYGLVLLVARLRRRTAGLPLTAAGYDAARVGAVGALALVAALVFTADRGLPLAFVILLALVVVVDLLTQHTQLGQSIYAVGGNAEAAARAGINVRRVRLGVFVAASTFAAAGGVMAASRLYAVGQSSGSGDVLLNAIAAVVIGGTSLFGGRGRAWAALAGILVIGAISNGMDLLGLDSSVKLMITGAVLVLAVLPDSLARLKARRG